MKRLLALAAAAAALVTASGAAAFDNTEPFAAQQWYLTRDLAWDFWESPPELEHVKVAIVDSGIDGEHPDLIGRVVAARSFVGGSPYHDEQGHGTFIAGEIAANPTNGVGHRRARLQRTPDRRQGGRARRHGLAPGRGRRDPLGGQ